MSKSNKLLLLAVLVLPTGCVDYLNHYDTVTLAAGDSNRINRMLQTEDPFNEQSFDTDIDSDGSRAVLVIRKYQRAAPKGGVTKSPTAASVVAGQAASE